MSNANKVTIAVENITPSKAKRWLQTENKNNRHLSIRHVESLALSMRNGEWQDNGETIKFNGDATLVDGQHRLAAIVESGRSLDMHVARHLPKNAFDTIDQGKPRTLADALSRRGEHYYKELATAVRWYSIMTDSSGGKRKVSNPRGIKLLGDNPGIRDSVSFICDNAKCDIKRTRLVSPGLASCLHYLMRSKSVKGANDFWLKLGSGEGLDRSSAVWKLRDILIANKSSVEKMDRDTLKLLCIKAWNAYRDDTTFVRTLTKSDRLEAIR